MTYGRASIKVLKESEESIVSTIVSRYYVSMALCFKFCKEVQIAKKAQIALAMSY